LDPREPDPVIVLGFRFFRGKTGFRVNGEEGDGLEQRTPCIDLPLEPAEADFEVTDAPRSMGGILGAEAIALDGHALGGAIENDDRCDEVESF
jgi:hypothetical protein